MLTPEIASNREASMRYNGALWYAWGAIDHVDELRSLNIDAQDFAQRHAELTLTYIATRDGAPDPDRPRVSSLPSIQDAFGDYVAAARNEITSTCRHCGRRLVKRDGKWIDPDADGDDIMWRETCAAHDTFTAEHEPTV